MSTDPVKRQVVQERLTIGFIPKAVASLVELHTLTGLSRASVVNRAVQLYAYIAQQLALGNEVLIRDSESGQVEKVHFL